MRQHASRYLERVKAGETIEVTERGALVALLSPPSSAASGRDRLVRSGRLKQGSKPFELPKRAVIKDSHVCTAKALEESREESIQ
ncbi:hypothetical protein BH23ACT12_BH23ACT12_01320 [soil metagenome]